MKRYRTGHRKGRRKVGMTSRNWSAVAIVLMFVGVFLLGVATGVAVSA